jgi:hypothetical protein
MAHPLYDLLQKLDEAHIHYTLGRNRDETVMVTVSFVGERAEIEVFDDGHMEVARFLGTEDILGGKELAYDLIAKETTENELWETHNQVDKNKSA